MQQMINKFVCLGDQGVVFCEFVSDVFCDMLLSFVRVVDVLVSILYLF